MITVKCPNCNKNIRLVYEVKFDKILPDEGDMAYCNGCDTISIFDNDITLRIPTDEELEKINQDPTVKLIKSRLN